MTLRNETVYEPAPSLDFITTIETPDHQEGRIYWDEQADTLAIMTDIDGVVLQAGQENYVKARNDTGAQIDNGEVVYVTGATGNRPTIAKAQADDVTKIVTLGVATEDIANNANGYVTTMGLVRNVNTNAFNVGDTLYLSEATAGGLRNSVPDSPNFVVRIGYVLIKNPANGVILVASDGQTAWGDLAGGNYSRVEPDGTLVFIGNATVWEDSNFDPIAGRGANAPDLINFNGTTIPIAAFDGAATLEQVSDWREHPHAAKEGEDIVLHVHWAPTDANAGNVKWNIEYEFLEGTSVLASGTASATQAAPGTAWQEQRLDIATVDGSSLVIGAQFGIRLFRDPSDDDDTYGSDAVVFTYGYHYQRDTGGSRGIVTK